MFQAEMGAIIILSYLRSLFAVISLISGWPWSTVHKVIAHATNGQFIWRNPCSSRPRISIQWQWWSIMWVVKKDRQISCTRLCDMYALNVLLTTMNQYLCQNNYSMWLAKKRPKLEDKNKFQKLQWALRLQDWTHKKWEGVIWCDECLV